MPSIPLSFFLSLYKIKPWKTLCGFPPTSAPITLRLPNGSWRPDTVITDYEGNEMFVLLDQANQMRSYEAVFGDLDGRRLVCVKRHLQRAFWRDGYYFCTYRPNYAGQRPLTEHDVDNKKLYPFSYLQVSPLKGRFFYRLFNADEELDPPRMKAENPWLGFMSVCCTPAVRCGNWTGEFKKTRSSQSMIYVDQWKNVVDVGPGNDLLSALCMAYVFDRVQCQPLVTVVGERDNELEGDDESIDSAEQEEAEARKKAKNAKKGKNGKNGKGDIELTNMPPKGRKKHVSHGGTGNVAYPKKPVAQDERYARGARVKKPKKEKPKPAESPIESPGENYLDEPFDDSLGPAEII
jgi:hypothetical protein